MISPIILKMAHDLKINQYNEEHDDHYTSRVLYTALSCWLRVCILDETNVDVLGIKSKSYTLLRGSQILSDFLDVFPESREYFCKPDTKTVDLHDAVYEIRERMINSGEFLEVTSKSNLTLPKYKEHHICNDIFRVYGLSENPNEQFYFSGISKHIYKEELVEEIPKFKTVSILDVLCKNAKWEDINDYSSYLIFNEKLNDAPYKCWQQTELKDNKVYLAKRKDYHTHFTFYLLKKDDKGTQISFIDELFANWEEEKRLILELRYLAGNQAKVKVIKKDIVRIIKLPTRLPQKEKIILNTYCWPKMAIYDSINYIVPNEVWNYIKSILIDLKLDVEEVL